MPRVVGIDPGTLSIDLCGLEEGEVFLDTTVPTGPDAAPEVVARLEALRPLDLVLGPAGYGLPLVPIEELTPRDLDLAFLPDAAGGGIAGLDSLVERLRASRLPVLFPPGVIHLPTVPPHRKLNRIDLGTADKVAVAALAILDQMKRRGVEADETAFVLVELGGAFTAVLTVEGGRIIDGAGGSSGPPGLRAAGALDGEVACLLGRVGKEVVFSGGMADVAGAADTAPEQLAGRRDERAVRARSALVEGVVKAVAGQLALLGRSVELFVSGRLTRLAGFMDPVAAALAGLGPVRPVSRIAERTKEAAQGAALLADGLAGGRFEPIVTALGIREARGSVLDHLYVAGSDRVRQRRMRANAG